MADLVMEVKTVSARRSGEDVVVEIAGEQANSRDAVFTDSKQDHDSADVYVRVKPSGGFGTEMTGPFTAQAIVSGAGSVKTVRVHGRNGVKSTRVS
ncbi:MAG: hypothetical protein LC772_11565 [Chloroflexi bacterium]|nr:hypothetical protein [Chloroflexota bacterium]